MRSALFIVPILAITACTSAQELCIDDATKELNTLDGLIAETQGNIDRGYAEVEEQKVRDVAIPCDPDASFLDVVLGCDEEQIVTETRQVAVDIEQEQRKLATLQERRATAQSTADQAIAQCRARYAE